MAIDDGDGLVALARANTKVLEAPVPLGFHEVPDDPVLKDLHPIGQHESRVMSVGVDIDRRYRTAGEQLADPGNDVAFWEFLSNAHTDLAKFAEAKDVQLMHAGGLDDVRGQFFSLFVFQLFVATCDNWMPTL